MAHATNTYGSWNEPLYPQPYKPQIWPVQPLPQVYPNTTVSTINWNLEYKMTEKDIDAVADRVIQKLKSELLDTVMTADPKAFMALLMKAVAEG